MEPRPLYFLRERSKRRRKFTENISLERHLNADAGTRETEETESPNCSTETSFFHGCDNCQRKFARRFDLLRHVNAGVCTKAKSNPKPKLFECNNCKAKYKQKCNLVKHLTKCDGEPKEYVGVVCPECGHKAQSKSEMERHCSENHGISFKVTNEMFQSFEEFKKWMNDIEKKNTFRFTRRRRNEGRLYTVEKYQCHRSGMYVDSCTNKRRKRFLKSCGSKKIQGWCPAELKVKIRSSDGTCAVQYQETHIGHKVGDEKELCHVYLNKEEKLQLAARIAAGVQIPRLRKSIQLSEVDSYSRISTVNLKDLHNIASSHGVLRDYPLPFNNDELDINTFMEEHRESVLYYKRQGEADTKYHTLRDEDLVIVFMNRDQESAMRLYAGKLVCFNGTHGTNPYEFMMHTMLVADFTSSEGKPVAFLISNRNDETVVDVMLESIRDKVGIITTKTFMTDMQPSYYNSWINVMGNKPEYYLFCSWHVREAWQRHFSEIAEKEMREHVSAKLMALADEESCDIFEEGLAEFLQMLESNPQTEAFLQYFRDNYLPYTHRWAYCYRLDSGINTNMHLEVFHRKLKVSICEKKKVKTLSDCLDYILDYLSLQKTDDRAKQIRMQSVSKLDCLRKRHHKAVDYLEENNSVNVCSVDEGTLFVIQSFEESKEAITKTYTVKQNTVKECDQADAACLLFCNLCGICAHEYCCSCVDSSVKNNMCKHIHAIAISVLVPQGKNNRNDFTVSVDVEDNFADNADDHISIKCENNTDEAEKMKLYREELIELTRNSLSYASSMEQLYEIKKRFVDPIKPTLLAANKRRLNST